MEEKTGRNISLFSMILWPIISAVAIMYMFILVSELFDNFYPYIVSVSPASVVISLLFIYVSAIIPSLLAIYKIFPRIIKILFGMAIVSSVISIIFAFSYCLAFGTSKYKSFALGRTINFVTNEPLNPRTKWLNIHLGIDKNTTDAKSKIDGYITARTTRSGIITSVIFVFWIVIQSYMLYKLRKYFFSISDQVPESAPASSIEENLN